MIYPDFYHNYVKLVKHKPVVEILIDASESANEFYNSFKEEQWLITYAEGKWTIKEMLGHIIDTERIMSYRALRFARADKTPLAGFTHEDYVKQANFNTRSGKDLIKEFNLVRQSNIFLFSGLSSQNLQHAGVADGGEVSVEALGYISAGHELYHREIIKNRYLS